MGMCLEKVTSPRTEALDTSTIRDGGMTRKVLLVSYVESYSSALEAEWKHRFKEENV